MKCKCGCGHITPIYQRNKTRKNHFEVKGQHADYVPGHNNKGKCNALKHGFKPLSGDCYSLYCAIDAGGYTRFQVNNIQYYGHDYFWRLAGNIVPEGMVLDHICNNPACVNIAHLRLLSRSDNMLRGRGLYLEKEGL